VAHLPILAGNARPPAIFYQPTAPSVGRGIPVGLPLLHALARRPSRPARPEALSGAPLTRSCSEYSLGFTNCWSQFAAHSWLRLTIYGAISWGTASREVHAGSPSSSVRNSSSDGVQRKPPLGCDSRRRKRWPSRASAAGSTAAIEKEDLPSSGTSWFRFIENCSAGCPRIPTV
jgi:hypothetical protein